MQLYTSRLSNDTKSAKRGGGGGGLHGLGELKI